MSKKSILKIILIVLAVFILLIAFLWFFYNREASPAVNNGADNRNYGSLNRNSSNNNSANQQNGAVNSTVEFMSIAKLAAERFGSYSSDTHNFENLRDMKYLMTDKMKQQTDDLIDGLLIDNSLPQEYYGVTTNALSVKIISHNKKQDVEVVVPCQKVETKGRDNPISKTKYQSARIKMLYVNEKWLVDELQWE